VNSQHVAAA